MKDHQNAAQLSRYKRAKCFSFFSPLSSVSQMMSALTPFVSGLSAASLIFRFDLAASSSISAVFFFSNQIHPCIINMLLIVIPFSPDLSHAKVRTPVDKRRKKYEF
jgi:hypothetical protein